MRNIWHKSIQSENFCVNPTKCFYHNLTHSASFLLHFNTKLESFQQPLNWIFLGTFFHHKQKKKVAILIWTSYQSHEQQTEDFKICKIQLFHQSPEWYACWWQVVWCWCVDVTCIVVGEMTVFVQHKDNLDKINSKPHTNTNPPPEIEKTFPLQYNLTTT